MNVRLTKEQRVRVVRSSDIYPIMKQILLRENKYGRTKEHFWVVGLANDKMILYIELVSLGSISASIVNPNEVFRIAAQKLAVSVILIHNHPSGNLEPSKEDKELTDRLIQAAKIIDTEVTDHLIISGKEYYSFLDTGLLDKLKLSRKWVPRYELEAKYRNEGKEKGVAEGIKNGFKTGTEKGHKEGKNEGIALGKLKGREVGEKEGEKKGRKEEKIVIAKKLKKNGVDTDTISKTTGLPKIEIKRL